MHAVEHVAAVRDQAREDIETAGGAFRIGQAGDAFRQIEMFEQLHHIDAALFKHRAALDVDLVVFELIELLLDRLAAAG